MGLFGAALLFGDGIITPALSVLSAVEGLRVATPAFEPFIVPITVGILAGLFSIQRHGTGRVGQFFGPVMLLWFLTLAVLGIRQIALHPHVLNGLHPKYAVAFFGSHGMHGTLILGAVFLAVTGAEALYADLGHCGRGPIQRTWFAVVFPCLLLNYFGQGALLLMEPERVDDVFYHLAPAWALHPIVGLATGATVIASQAVISGVFSLTAQAVQLQYFPRAVIRHTSPEQRGQIFVPAANRFLLVGSLALVVAFRSSGGLADAYGIAVSLTMVITTALLFFVMRDVWRWPGPICVALTLTLVLIDLAFFGSIVRKVASGGWIPLSIAVVLVVVMAVWRRGRQLVDRHRPEVPIDALGPREGSVVFLVRDPAQVGSDVDLGDRAFLLYVNRCHRPYMIGMPHGELREHEGRVFVHACFGFMETADIPALLSELDEAHSLGIDPAGATYVVIKEALSPTNDRGMPRWAKWLFGALSRRASGVPQTIGIPPAQVVVVSPSVPV